MGTAHALFSALARSRSAATLARRLGPVGPARRFLAGRTPEEAVAAAVALRARGRRATLNALGEHEANPDRTRAARDLYLRTARLLAAAGCPVRLAIKPSHLGMQLSPELCRDNVAAIIRAAAVGGFVRLDMEGSALTTATLGLYRSLRAEWEGVGLAIQANLRRSPDDLAALDALAPAVRLVKGAYREPAEVAWQHPDEVRAALMALIDRQLRRGFRTTVGSHDHGVIAFARERARALGLAPGLLDFEMLQGVRPDLQAALAAEGEDVTAYLPFGPDWLPYFARRLAERPEVLLELLRPR